MSDSEYERLSAVVESNGMTLGEWVREVLPERAGGRKPSVIEETLLAEVIALRTILLNLHFAVAKGETITAEDMQAIIGIMLAGFACFLVYRASRFNKDRARQGQSTIIGEVVPAHPRA